MTAQQPVRCPLCPFEVALGHERRSLEEWTLLRHLVSTDPEHDRFVEAFSTFLKVDAARVRAAMARLREARADERWWVGGRDRDQLTGAYVAGTERQDPLTGRWHP